VYKLDLDETGSLQMMITYYWTISQFQTSDTIPWFCSHYYNTKLLFIIDLPFIVTSMQLAFQHCCITCSSNLVILDLQMISAGLRSIQNLETMVQLSSSRFLGFLFSSLVALNYCSLKAAHKCIFNNQIYISSNYVINVDIYVD